MKKFLAILSVLALLVCVSPAAADIEVILLTAEVTLVDIDIAARGPHMVHLMLPNGSEMDIRAIDCRFLDSRNNEVSPKVFLDNYRGKKISIDFMEIQDIFVIFECRGSR